MLLTLVCILFHRTGQFPINRSTLYEKALRVLLEEWREDQGVPAEEIYKGLDTKRKEILIASLAYETFCHDSLFIWERRITQHIEEVLKDMMPDTSQVSGRKILENIEVQHGLLVKQAESVYSFSHESMQEFLAAQYISESYGRTRELVKEHLVDPRYTEIFLFLSGLRTADDLLEVMEETALKFIDGENLRHFLRWISEMTTMSSGYSAVRAPVRRIAAAYFIVCVTFFTTLTERRSTVMREILNDLEELIREIDSRSYSSLYETLKQTKVFTSCLVQYMGLCDPRVKSVIQRNQNTRESGSKITKLQALRRLSEQSIKLLDLTQRNLIFPRFQGGEVMKVNRSILKQESLDRVENDVIYAQRVGNKVYFAWLKDLNLDLLKYKNISSAEFEGLKKYIQALVLMQKCAQSAVKKSKDGWYKIEGRMFFEKWLGNSSTVLEPGQDTVLKQDLDSDWRG